jgi:hypothetical protein
MRCKKEVEEKEICCDKKSCSKWINFEEDLNCCLISVSKHGNLTLVQVAERLGISHVRVKQIQDKALEKLKRNEDIHDLDI